MYLPINPVNLTWACDPIQNGYMYLVSEKKKKNVGFCDLGEL